MWIGVLANRATREGSFLKGFFLGNRGLGSWALALTATVQSGGTFMGYPSLVYTHGWSVVALDRQLHGRADHGVRHLGQAAGANLAPLRGHYDARLVPRAISQSRLWDWSRRLFILFYMSFMMVAQFKAGALDHEDFLGRHRELVGGPERRAAIRSPTRRWPDSLAARRRLSSTRLRPLVGRTYADERQLSEDVEAALKKERRMRAPTDTQKILAANRRTPRS